MSRCAFGALVVTAIWIVITTDLSWRGGVIPVLSARPPSVYDYLVVAVVGPWRLFFRGSRSLAELLGPVALAAQQVGRVYCRRTIRGRIGRSTRTWLNGRRHSNGMGSGRPARRLPGRL